MLKEGKCLFTILTKKDALFQSRPVGTQFSQAVGVAMASSYKGVDEVTITWLGMELVHREIITMG